MGLLLDQNGCFTSVVYTYLSTYVITYLGTYTLKG